MSLQLDIEAAVTCYGHEDRILTEYTQQKIDQYVERLGREGQLGFHITWGDKAVEMTQDERLDTIIELEYLPSVPMDFCDLDRSPHKTNIEELVARLNEQSSNGEMVDAQR